MLAISPTLPSPRGSYLHLPDTTAFFADHGKPGNQYSDNVMNLERVPMLEVRALWYTRCSYRQHACKDECKP